jgi:hypothetical protein
LLWNGSFSLFFLHPIQESVSREKKREREMLASLPMKNEIQAMKIKVNSVIENALSNGILRELIEYLGSNNH